MPRLTRPSLALVLALPALAASLAAQPSAPAAPVQLEKVEVTTKKETLSNSIDRKIYQVGKEIQSATGSASGLLQNIPSVEVDVEGNVALRGDANVLILIDGKSSNLMGANRAAVLEQMSADSIERIEVITNPSAKYKPDGTAGIINLVLKKKAPPGHSGSLRASVGNDRRANLGANGSLTSGKTTFTGSYSLRQDDRRRFSPDLRSHLDAATTSLVTTEQRATEIARPLSHIGQLGLDYKFTPEDKFTADVRYNRRANYRHALDAHLTRLASGLVTDDYDRLRDAPELESDLELRGGYQHAFAEDGHELNFDFKHDTTAEIEDNYFTNNYRRPVSPSARDAKLIRKRDRNIETTLEYLRPLPHDAKLEAGYVREAGHGDHDFRGENYNPATLLWTPDPATTNRFIYEETVHALYATYGRPLGNFAFLAGARAEQATITADQVTSRLVNHNDYFRFYPSLHLTYDLTERHQLQLNYSHRIHRPESDDVNPFPEYLDPTNVRAGNPRLRPEDTHSFEAGWQSKAEDTTYLATVYHRLRYHGFTQVSRYINATTLLTTFENLASSRSSGLELAATRTLGPVSLNASSNLYRNEIDASNLGFSATRTAFAWNAKLNANYHATKSTLVQLNASYNAARLTPQGERAATWVANLGARHDLADKKTALILTVSDLFDSLREHTVINTPTLTRDVIRRRSPRTVYLGVIYNFGASKKKAKDELQFDNSL